MAKGSAALARGATRRSAVLVRGATGRSAVLVRGAMVALAASGVAAAMASTASAAQAATFHVNSTADAVDAHPGDGKCAAASGRCTLRAAVMEADLAVGKSTIVVPAGRFKITIPPAYPTLLPVGHGTVDVPDPTTGDLDLTGTTTIRGAGPGQTIVDGNRLDRVFSVGGGGTATLTGMTITGGDITRNNQSQDINLGGGVLNANHVTLNDIALVNNIADGGGGMFSIPGTVPVIDHTLIAGNRAVEGGGLRLDGGGTILNTTITGNTLSPIAFNLARPISIVVPLVPEISGWGGGIDNRGSANLSIINSTITDNHAVKGGGGLNAAQGYAPLSDQAALGTVTLRNTIIADNTSTAGPQQCHHNQVDIVSAGDNLASDDSCFLTAKGDLPQTNPLLAPLADNGGPTMTQALLAGSPAIGAASNCPATDQRDFPRPTLGPCDIGAYEYTTP